VDSETYVQLSAEGPNGGLRYKVTDHNRKCQWGDLMRPPDDRRADPTLTGDRSAPYRSAVPPFLDRSRLICVTPSDYGSWELKDKALTAVLPNMNMIQRMLTVFFKPADDSGPPRAPLRCQALRRDEVARFGARHYDVTKLLETR
jgi:hypothetical protein